MSPEFVIILIIKSRPVNSVVALKDWLGTLALSVMGHFLNTHSERVRTTASNVSFSSCQRQFESSERWANILSRNFRPGVRWSIGWQMFWVMEKQTIFNLAKNEGRFHLLIRQTVPAQGPTRDCTNIPCTRCGGWSPRTIEWTGLLQALKYDRPRK